jgi:N-acyl-D-amino-acid deacylase
MHVTLVCRMAEVAAACLLLTVSCRSRQEFDTVLRRGTIYDGTGNSPFVGDVAIVGDSIAAIGPSLAGRGKREIDVHGLAVAPGFVNMLSWATESLLEDGRSQSDIRQGVTLEVFGEGWSMGPLTDTMKKIELFEQGDIKYPVTWTTLNEYLNTLVSKGVSPNVASFIGATTVRIHELGWDNRPPTAAELGRMQRLVRQAMEEGAVGVGSSLIYAPAFYAKTGELVALAKAAAPYGGMYISHIRSEGNRLLESVDELITIAREAGVRAEVYHLKAAGQANWPKMDQVISKVDSARRAGLAVSANLYPYPAGLTGLDASMPPWVQEGGYLAWARRLRDPKIRARVKREMTTPSNDWENYYLAAGAPDRVLLVTFKADSLKYLTGKTLAAVAKLRRKSPEETAMDLVVQDGSRVGTIYFFMSEDNIRKQIAQPWVSLGSDEGSYSPEGVFLKSNPHPRAYGTFARFLGKYVREEGVIPLEEAVRRLTWRPMSNLRIPRRGKLAKGFYADVVVFDPAIITDHATFDRPHQYATGVLHVLVNGTLVLADGEHTGAKPGRVLRGPGWRGRH